MAKILLRDVPDDVHERLREQADANRRSMNQEAVHILEEALRDRAGSPSLEKLDELRIRGRGRLTDALLREARESGRP